MQLSQALRTERAISEIVSAYTDHDGYSLYRSEQFPTFYGGNGLELTKAGKSLVEWESITESHFDPSRFVHKTFTFADDPAFGPLIGEADKAGYNIERNVWMSCMTPPKTRILPAGYSIVKVESDSDWMRFAQLLLESYKEYDWYDPKAKGPDRLYEKLRVVAERLNVEWFVVQASEGHYVAKAGIFTINSIARLQDVATLIEYRRQGLAAVLLSYIIHRAFEQGVSGVVLTTDSDYHAVGLYDKLGFSPLGYTVQMMKYPVKQ